MSRRPKLGEEGGVALAVAIVSLAMMLGLSAVALQQAVSAIRHSNHDTHVKRALQAADAAIDAATHAVARADIGSTLKINPLNPTSVITQNCVVATGAVGGIDLAALDPLTPKDAGGNQWCPETAPETTESGATFSYRISQLTKVGAGACDSGTLNLNRQVVAVGSSGGVTRRVHARLSSNLAILSGAAVQSSSKTANMVMQDTAQVLGDVRSNAGITGALTNTIAGNATPGTGKTVSSPGPVVTGSKAAACQPFTIPDVDQSTAPTVNNNVNGITLNKCLLLASLIQTPCIPATGGSTYTPATRTLRVYGNGLAILTRSTYSFCSIKLEGNGILQVDKTVTAARVFLDDPANCAGVANAGQITSDGGSRIVNCHLSTQPQTLQIYAVGGSTATTQTLQGSNLVGGTLRNTLCGNVLSVTGDPMTIVAPHSTVLLGGTVSLSGQVAAQEVRMANASAVRPVAALVNLDSLGSKPILPLYRASEYTECSGLDFSRLPPAAPAQGC